MILCSQTVMRRSWETVAVKNSGEIDLAYLVFCQLQVKEIRLQSDMLAEMACYLKAY